MSRLEPQAKFLCKYSHSNYWCPDDAPISEFQDQISQSYLVHFTPHQFHALTTKYSFKVYVTLYMYSECKL